MRFLAAFYRLINRFVPWHKLPYSFLPKLSLRLWNLPALRHDLRRYNLHSTSCLPTRPEPRGYRPPIASGRPLANPFQPPDPFHPDDLRYRRVDGSYNDLQDPNMGRLCSRYSRNFPLEESWPRHVSDNSRDPTPREVSNRLMVRTSFRAAESLNLLAAAWIQFQVHDWARHITDSSPENRLRIPLAAGDKWPQKTHDGHMEVERTCPDHTRPPECTAGPPTFLADGTFWWDGSQIYGHDQTRQRQLRSGSRGTLKLTRDNRLPDDPLCSGIDLTGFMGGWWAGLSMLHTLFAREHNAVCEMLQARYPAWAWNDHRVFQTARLITSALMAKIHTVEWTPAILGMPVMKIGMGANWWGLFGEQIGKRFGRLSGSEALSGIPGSSRNHHGAPYALTEEFVSVYRMHPLIPDEYRFHSLQMSEYTPHMQYQPHFPLNAPVQAAAISDFDHIQGLNTRRAIDAIGMENAFYSFGLAHPGVITLHNYPHFLRQYRPPDKPDHVLDVATIDILRDRERGVPRYNRFRELLRMPRVKTFDELNPQWAKEMSDLYGGDIDRVDTMVGLLGEEPPEGFGFSDTAFRVFIVMASRRLKSDRFFTTDYRPEVYTQAGLDWINENGFESVLLRHYPALGPAVQGLANPFHPWRNVHEAVAV
jgi:hypothetical protein